MTVARKRRQTVDRYGAVSITQRSALTSSIPPISPISQEVASTPVARIRPSRTETGAQILRFLREHPVCDALAREARMRSRLPTLPYPLVERIISTTRQVLDKTPASNIDDLCARVFANTSRPLVAEKSTTLDEYVLSFTGENVRWETIGIILSVAARALTTTMDRDLALHSIGHELHDRDTLLLQLGDITNMSIDFCNTASSSNFLLVALLINDVMLKTQQYGDSSFQSWRRLGDVCSTVYHCGLHKVDPETSSDPDFLIQWKLAIFAIAFASGKGMATFLGMPPHFNKLYCKMILPLDLSDEALVSNAATLGAAINELGADGWNPHGQIYRASLARLRLVTSMYRVEVWEARAAPVEESVPKVQRLLTDLKAWWDSCPDHLHFEHLSQDDDERRQFDSRTFTVLVLYLEYLHSRLLLYEHLDSHGDEWHQGLINTASKMLATVVRANTYRTPQIDLGRDYSWVSLYHGLPCANIIAQELMRCKRSPDAPSPLNSSEAIRTLCVFTSDLTWVTRPSYGDYPICKDAERRLSQMLDEILSTSTPAPTPADLDIPFLDDVMLWDGDAFDMGSALFN